MYSTSCGVNKLNLLRNRFQHAHEMCQNFRSADAIASKCPCPYANRISEALRGAGLSLVRDRERKRDRERYMALRGAGARRGVPGDNHDNDDNNNDDDINKSNSSSSSSSSSNSSNNIVRIMNNKHEYQ